jgi:predicted permease
LALTTLALGIAGTVTIYTVVSSILLRPLPYPDSQSLVLLWHTAPAIDLPMIGQADGTYFYYRDDSRTLEHISVFDDTQVTLLAGAEPERIDAGLASASLFAALGVGPAHGRIFREDEERPGAAPVVVLDHDLWSRRFGADPGVLGDTVEIDGVSTEIIGVMPADFDFPDDDPQLWLPLPLDPAGARLSGFGYIGVARLRPGVEPEHAEAELNQLLGNLEERFAGDETATFLSEGQLAAMVKPAHEFTVGDLRAALWIVLGAIAFLLLIACANVANLFLVRAEARQREIAIRRALGETRGRLVASIFGESLIVALAAGLLAMPLAAGAIDLLVAYGPRQLPRIHEISIDASVMLFALIVSLTSGLLLGVGPALRACVSSLPASLGDGTRSMTAGRSRHRARSLLVSGQIALALVLLVGSGLAARSFGRLSNVHPGFQSADLWTFQVYLPEAEYPDATALAAFYFRLHERLASIPGVEAVAAVSSLPLSGSVSGEGYIFEDLPHDATKLPPILFTKWVSGPYFETLGIPLLEGRLLERADADREAPVVVINQAIANHYWPGESAVGRRLYPDSSPPAEGDQWLTVVGVVGDVRDRGLHEQAPELVYYPLSAVDDLLTIPRRMSFALRGPGQTAVVAAARQAVRELDPRLPLSRESSLESLVDRSRQLRAFTMYLLIAAAGFALLLGAVGLYGVISYLVGQRGQEIAIRMAVGAHFADIRRLVLREALILGAAGIAVGLVGAAALTRSMGSLLFEVSPLDPLTYLLVPLVLAVVVVLASYVPARRAAAVDPSRALHQS